MSSPKDVRFPCAWCGEPIVPGRDECPHCNQTQPEPGAEAPVPNWTTLDLHNDLPTWEEAERRLNTGLSDLVLGRTRSLLIVHGWGRSGHGGAIKRRLHARLQTWAGDTLSKSWHPGEQLGSEAAWARLPERLQCERKLRNRLQGNPGVTLVLG